ncbi:hypothetical protein F503_07525 [Ophiostoma piceae UAMH 11346]|uniref:Uncharacterized protein n=1 Tax=Ophiostoma piceae (strain UAMH 11346) TaxID=1262450 RepID=S3C8D2_OPHP1|nr:hypothetical protein F503_07525 [Ophiostoma piceae UAMH 11346]
MSALTFCKDRPWDISFDSAVCAYSFVGRCIYYVQRWIGLPDWLGFTMPPEYQQEHFISTLLVLYVVVFNIPPLLLALAEYAVRTDPGKVNNSYNRLRCHWNLMRRQTALAFFIVMTLNLGVAYKGGMFEHT